MASIESLKRLGGGRWETKDGRYTVEPQSGTWVVVDNEQTNELGLPLVRGPFPTLTAAKQAIEQGREAGPAESPLAEELKRTPKATEKPKPKAPEPPAEPKWLRDLDSADQRRARTLIAKLEKLEVRDPEQVARAEIAHGEPALARLALERKIAAAMERDRPAQAVRDVVEAILRGRDDELKARWRLVDGEDREIRRLDLPD